MVRVRQWWVGGLAAVILVLGLGHARPAVAQADPALGLADDGGLVTAPVDPDGVLSVGVAHGASFVRVIAYMGRYPNDDRYVQAAQRVAAHGMSLDVVLALPWGQAQAGIGPADFSAWASQLAARLEAVGAPIRFSLLNEPDLLLSAIDSCDPVTALKVITASGYVAVEKRVRVTLRRSRIARRVVRRHGRRRVIRPRLVWKVHRWKSVKTLRSTTETSGAGSTVTVAQGCLSIRRARRAAAFLNAAIPAVRAVVGGTQVGAGETSPVGGVEVFIREIARVGIPRIDRWAHHPYVFTSNGQEVDSPAGWMGADRLVDYARIAHTLFGANTPIDLTEFGVRHSGVPDPQVRAEIWRRTYARACAIQARSLVAYQWTPTPADEDRVWETAILGDGYAPTPESEQLPTLRC